MGMDFDTPAREKRDKKRKRTANNKKLATWCSQVLFVFTAMEMSSSSYAFAPSISLLPLSVPCQLHSASRNTDSALFVSTTNYPATLDTLSPVEIERRIVKLGRRGRTDEALDLYKALQARPVQLNIRHVNAAIDACSRSRPVRWDKALSILNESSISPNVYTLGALLNACARNHDAKAALHWLHALEPTVKPNAVCYQAAMTACARARDLQAALKLLNEAERENIVLTVVGYNVVVSAAAKLGRVDIGLRILRNMTDPLQSKPQPDAITYGTLLSACESAGDWERLLSLSEEMTTEGLQLDGISWTSVLHACEQLGLADRAISSLDRMKQDLKDVRHPEGWRDRRQTAGWKVADQRAPLTAPDEVAYRFVISACGRAGSWGDAMRVLEEVETVGQASVMSYVSAILACESCGKWKESFALLDRMRRRNVEPNEATFAAVLSVCASACSLLATDQSASTYTEAKAKALRLLDVVRTDPTTVDPSTQVYNAAIRVCAESQDVDGALEVYQKLVTDDIVDPDIVTYGSLMMACQRSGDIDAMDEVFRLLRADQNVDANEVVYGAAISTCRKANQSERSFRLLKKMLDDKLRPNTATFNTVLTAQAEALMRCRDRGDDNAQSSVLLKRLVETFRLLHQCDHAAPNRQSFTVLIRVLADQRQAPQAEAFLTHMRRSGFVPEVDLYTATVTSYERLGYPLRALSLMESMSADGYDFYDIPVLNTAFKRLVKVVNVVGKGLQGSEDHLPPQSSFNGTMLILE